MVSNAWKLLHYWRSPPRVLDDGNCTIGIFTTLFDEVTNICENSGSLAIALQKVGAILYHFPEESESIYLDKQSYSQRHR